ncbi:Squamosa promoter-binding-like protein 9 [Ananas comosus]|uniref:Squamosa promoter-binding-like protein 9 n=1 Tax=Ananas comosus TaxID=4615 RepID=A0A199W1S9_ANACO|nr:Squamosa promoter-binding-like protein 9 [Ananas comosus]
MEIPTHAPTAAVAAADDSAAMWDWGNLLDFAINDGDDPLILPWAGSDDGRSPPSPPLAAEQSPPPPPPAPPPAAAAAAAAGTSRVRKRDPRLVCPNYLAGRVPCSCPELDEQEVEEEEEEDVAEVVAGARKRVRAGGAAAAAAAAVRCQVPGCEADIRELKGYHRRHRVCLRCANASSVLLDGEHKRYCQQCGK